MKPIFSRAMTPPRPSGARVESPRIGGRWERSSRKRVGDRGDDVVEVRDVVVGAIDRTGRLRHDEHLCAGLAGDEIRDIGRIPALEQDDLDLRFPHPADERGEMLRGRRDAGPVLDDATRDEGKGPVQVRPAVVMGYDSRTSYGRRQSCTLVMRAADM